LTVAVILESEKINQKLMPPPTLCCLNRIIKNPPRTFLQLSAVSRKTIVQLNGSILQYFSAKNGYNSSAFSEKTEKEALK